MENKTKELVTIAMGIAFMIVIGLVVYKLLLFYPVPGFKYAIMGPLTGMFLYMIQINLNTKHSLLKIVLPFSILMGIINIFMLIILLPASLVSEAIALPIKNRKLSCRISSVSFTFIATTSALYLAKYSLDVIPMSISDTLLASFSLLSLVLSVLSISLGDYYINKLKRSDLR